ncbi:MAG: hypothetical protein RBT22_06195 [Aliarcobacter sp.]|jgi:hypothetical protein|nr:hypothetical protein [Aliarcobacter sp.]
MSIRTEEELAQSIKNNEDFIEIEGDLARKVIKIKATGKVAWIIACGAIAVAVTAVIVSGGTATPASAFIAGGAVTILGLPTTVTAISIAVVSGGIASLNKLRDYQIILNENNRIILKK